jgi:D-tyrosyl-tRNA(Tyr) deacylase
MNRKINASGPKFKIMKAVIQRVSEASVTVNAEKVAEIGHGVLILLGIEHEDTQEDIAWLSAKIAKLRIFNDESDVMNTSLIDTNGEAIVVSQFTLHASTKKGNRPSYLKAAKSEISIPLYEAFVKQLEQDIHKKVQTGIFGADMKVALLNDGPVTIIIDTKNKE